MEKQYTRTTRMNLARTTLAFTLVELLLATAVLSLILIVATSVMTQTQKTWLQASARTEQFREARLAFELITQNLSQGTLNTYMTYQYNEGSTPTVPVDKLEVPKRYIRHSELQFVTGSAAALLGGPGNSLPGHAVFFQGAIGVSQRDGYESMNRLLCGRGYFVMHGDDSAYRPAHVTQARTRFRLMEYRPPAERNEIYSVNPGLWFKDAHREIIGMNESATHSAYTRPVTENILALIISPQVPAAEAAGSGKTPYWIAPTYAYDSVRQTGQTSNNLQGTQHLLPPLVQVTLIALDENSARRLEDRAAGATPNVLPAGAFQSASQYEGDMQSLEANLREEKLNYRIFSATVPLRNSKWAMYGH